MAEQWMQVLQDLPPGTDIFDFIKDTITDQMFPQFGKVYWSFLWLAIGLLSLTLVAIFVGFYIRIKRGGFSWMIVLDGACTHVSPKASVPFFWGLMSALLIGQIAWTYRVLNEKIYTGAFSAYSIIVGATPIMSFSCLTLHVWTKAPPFRRFLIRLGNSAKNPPTSLLHNRAVILINTGLLLFAVFAGSILIIPGRHGYKSGDMAGATYKAAMQVIDQAKATGNVAGLAGLTTVFANSDSMELARRKVNDINGRIFSPFFIFYLFAAIFPAIFLNIYIRNRIKDCGADLSTSQDISVLQSCESLPKPNLPLSPASISKSTKEPSESQARHVTVHLPAKLPKDRPFANIVAVNTTTVAPRHLQTILDQRGTSPAEKSRRLRAALRRDNQMLFAYCLLLAAMGSLAFYMLTGAPNRISANEALRINLLWEAYSFAIPASLMAAMFLYDAIRNGSSGENEFMDAPVPRSHVTQKAGNSLSNVIMLSQQVSVVEEYAMEEKPHHRGAEKYSVYNGQ
ncbi:hypothetical protein P389DRAFT_165385 [Cystobasidium minutum MCA 4210]|uniref:uncharacterized protein n=1 Tax=Cystobasidium minutum MCA 4210 TaxID=1397322 RepID=UPI0034CDD50C|eukprot:jgi/Rhomi1/165385/fgenesh1_kg.1_\